jgi:hypothetical protein
MTSMSRFQQPKFGVFFTFKKIASCFRMEWLTDAIANISCREGSVGIGQEGKPYVIKPVLWF